MMTPIAILNVAPVSLPSRPHILVSEIVSADGLALLTPHTPHYDVNVKLGLSADELISIIPGYQGLIVRSETEVTPEILQTGSKLKVIARAGVGVNNINVPAATHHRNKLACGKHLGCRGAHGPKYWSCRRNYQRRKMEAQ